MLRRFWQHQQSDWHYSIDNPIGLNFCLWVLQTDGLRVPPFDRHPDGDGTLRAEGMDEHSWKVWWDEVLHRHLEFHNFVQSRRRPTGDLVHSHYLSYVCWEGDPEVALLLEEMWNDYEPEANKWKKRIAERRPYVGRPAEERRFWRQLEPFRKVLPAPRIYVVEYPEAVIARVSSSAAVIGAPQNAIDPQSFRDLTFRAMQAMAGDAGT